MKRHIINKVVKFTGYTDLNGIPIHDWHDEYLGTVGMLSIYEEESEAPGKHFLYYYPNEPAMETQRYFQTAPGEISESDNRIVLIEKNKYIFETGEFVSDGDKALLWMNVFLR